MTIYIDSLFFVNLFMDLAIIFITSVLKRTRNVTYRIFFASLLSSLYGTLMFFPSLDFIYGFAGKLVVSGVVTAVAFKIRGIKDFFVSLAKFWGVSASLGGIVFAISIFTSYGDVMQTSVSNCIMYLNINPIILIAGCVLLYVMIESYRRMCIRNFSKEKIILPITVAYMNNKYELSVLIDTGCELTEPLSGDGMIVAEKRVFKGSAEPERFVYINTASGTAELPMLLPDCAECKSSFLKLNGVPAIALTDEEFCYDGLYNAIINPNMVSEISVIGNKNKILHKAGV